MNDTAQGRPELAASLRVLLAELIDYAGLFPPAGLSMPEAVRNYAQYLSGGDQWALGRFVAPAARLAEFAREWNRTGGIAGCRLSVLLANERDIEAALSFSVLHRGKIAVDSVEMKCAGEIEIQKLAKALPADVRGYAEIPIAGDVDRLVAAAGEAGLRTKIRTGGIHADLFPTSAAIARFLVAAASRRTAFKATAGLHHPIRCFRPLTYEADSPQGTMHGFLNLFIAAVLAWWGIPQPELEAILDEEDSSALAFSEDAIRWRKRVLTIVDVVTVRREFAIGFGSCSFEEPLDDLRTLGLLP